MMKFLTGLLAAVSSVFVGASDKQPVEPLPLNTSIISHNQTYYAPVVANLGNFPRAKEISSNAKTAVKTETKVKMPTVAIEPKLTSLDLTSPPPIPPPPIPPPTPPQDPYLVNPEPITSWLSMNLTLTGGSNDADNPRVLPEISFDREYWKLEVFAYWAPNILPPKPEIQKDYFKLEVYEKGTDKLIYMMTSGTDDNLHKFQTFRKQGTFYFKAYTKNPSKWEISFFVSPKIAQIKQ